MDLKRHTYTCPKAVAGEYPGGTRTPEVTTTLGWCKRCRLQRHTRGLWQEVFDRPGQARPEPQAIYAARQARILPRMEMRAHSIHTRRSQDQMRGRNDPNQRSQHNPHFLRTFLHGTSWFFLRHGSKSSFNSSGQNNARHPLE